LFFRADAAVAKTEVYSIFNGKDHNKRPTFGRITNHLKTSHEIDAGDVMSATFPTISQLQ